MVDTILSSKNSDRNQTDKGNVFRHKKQESVAYTGRFHTNNNREQKNIDSTPK
jgi:hypothetical protein